MSFNFVNFNKAKPVWLAEGAREMNVTLLFETKLLADSSAMMRMAGHFSYQVFINGNFVHFGPARAGRNFYRVDEVDIGKYLTESENKVVVLVNGYHCDSYYFTNEQAFLSILEDTCKRHLEARRPTPSCSLREECSKKCSRRTGYG